MVPTTILKPLYCVKLSFQVNHAIEKNKKKVMFGMGLGFNS